MPVRIVRVRVLRGRACRPGTRGAYPGGERGRERSDRTGGAPGDAVRRPWGQRLGRHTGSGRVAGDDGAAGRERAADETAATHRRGREPGPEGDTGAVGRAHGLV